MTDQQRKDERQALAQECMEDADALLNAIFGGVREPTTHEWLIAAQVMAAARNAKANEAIMLGA